jgi:hypothetical protein
MPAKLSGLLDEAKRGAIPQASLCGALVAMVEMRAGRAGEVWLCPDRHQQRERLEVAGLRDPGVGDSGVQLIIASIPTF